MRWLKENEGDGYRRAGYVLMAHDYLRYCLSGEFAVEETNISGSNLFNQHSGGFDPHLLTLFGIDEVVEKTAPIRHSAGLTGYVIARAAAISPTSPRRCRPVARR